MGVLLDHLSDALVLRLRFIVFVLTHHCKGDRCAYLGIFPLRINSERFLWGWRREHTRSGYAGCTAQLFPRNVGLPFHQEYIHFSFPTNFPQMCYLYIFKLIIPETVIE